MSTYRRPDTTGFMNDAVILASSAKRPVVAGAMVGRSYLLRGESVLVLVQWSGKAIKNLWVRWPDGREKVRPWWRGRRVS